MRVNDAHPSDQELLLYADGEISQRKAGQMRDHLAACGKCRARAAELDGAMSGFVELHRSRIDARLPRADRLRSSLKTQLAAAAKAPPSRLPMAFWQQGVYAAILLAMVAATMWRAHSGLFLSGRKADPVLASALPNRNLTPGYTRPAKLSELCSRRQSNAPLDEDMSIEERVFSEYGLPGSATKSYELDYLIAPDLGGADDVRNLWPEPYGSTDWNAHVKDELEDRLHTMVCNGQIDLATAQRDIATDWIAAYKRYFHTETPLVNPESVTLSRLEPSRKANRLARVVLVADRLATLPAAFRR